MIDRKIFDHKGNFVISYPFLHKNSIQCSSCEWMPVVDGSKDNRCSYCPINICRVCRERPSFCRGGFCCNFCTDIWDLIKKDLIVIKAEKKRKEKKEKEEQYRKSLFEQSKEKLVKPGISFTDMLKKK